VLLTVVLTITVYLNELLGKIYTLGDVVKFSIISAVIKICASLKNI